MDTYGKAAGSVASVSWDLPYGEPSTLDPINGVYYSASLVTDQLCDSLLRYTPDYHTVSNLATASQRGPLEIVFHLRRGVRFWDGHQMTSTDVVYDLRRTINPAVSSLAAIFTSVKSVNPAGKWEVVIHLKRPDELVLKEMASFASDVYEKAAAKRAGSKFGSAQGGIMCTGPYELKKWTPGSGIVLTANPHYWDASHAAHIRQISFSFNTNSTSLAESLSSGQLDGAYEVPAQVLPHLAKSSSGKLLYGPAPLYLQLYPARAAGPMSNVSLRKALFTSIDRSGLAKVVYNGAAQPNYTFLNSTTWDPQAAAQYAAAYKPYAAAGAKWGTSQALARARKLVKASGYHGQPIVLATLAGDATLSETAQLIQQEGQQIGLKIRIDALPAIQYSNATVYAKDRQGLDLLLVVGFNIADDPLEPLGFELVPGSPYNYGGYDNPAVTKLLTQARGVYDPGKRAQLVLRAQSIYEKDWPAATLLNIDEISYLNKRLSGMVTSFAYMSIPSLAAIGAAG